MNQTIPIWNTAGICDQKPPPTLPRKAPTSENHPTAIQEAKNTASAARKIIRKAMFYRLEAASAMAQIEPIISRITAHTSAKVQNQRKGDHSVPTNDSFQVPRKTVSARFTPSGETQVKESSPEVVHSLFATPITLPVPSHVRLVVLEDSKSHTFVDTSKRQFIQLENPEGVFGHEKTSALRIVPSGFF